VHCFQVETKTADFEAQDKMFFAKFLKPKGASHIVVTQVNQILCQKIVSLQIYIEELQ